MDTFARDHLPPRSAWPDLLLLDGPERVNAAVELLRHEGTAIAGGWSYAELGERAAAVAGALAIEPGERVLLHSPNTPEAIAAWLGILLAGGIVVATMPLLRWGEIEKVVTKARVRKALAARDVAGAIQGLDTLILEDLPARGAFDAVDTAADDVAIIAFTSGTTGTPKGASRKQPESLDPAAALFSKIPLRARETTVIAAPMFHSWGFAHFTLGMGLSSTLVLRRKFDPEAILSLTAQHEATALAVVPVMLQRMLELPIETIQKYDLSALRVIAASGSALPGELATRTMDAFGDVLYNLYGSTEVAWATIATPEDLRAAPGTAGRPPRGTIVKLYDENGNELTKPGETGRIFVANEMLFEGYTGGGNKALIEGLMSTGDVGHFDSGGHLFVDGRDDEMIVSGGENVFPREVEDLLANHGSIDEAAVIGVVDEKFGQRLKAFVVVSAGAEIDEAVVKDYIKENLARYKVPREVVFLEELPRNPTGKVLKRELE